MFQRSEVRQTSDQVDICEKCENTEDCTFKPDKENWRWVLVYCQYFED